MTRKIGIAVTAVAVAAVMASAQSQQAPVATKSDTAVVKADKQALPKRNATTQVPKPVTNWSKIKDLFL